MVWSGGRARVASGPKNPWVRLACGSLSINSTRHPDLANAADRWKHEDVLPTPPFWFRNVMVQATGGSPWFGGRDGEPFPWCVIHRESSPHQRRRFTVNRSPPSLSVIHRESPHKKSPQGDVGGQFGQTERTPPPPITFPHGLSPPRR